MRTLPTRAALAALAVLISLTGAACGGDDSSVSSGSSGGGGNGSSSESQDSEQALDPCTIIDEATMESVLGTDVTQDGDATDANRGRSCSWTVADGKVFVNTFHGSEFYADDVIGPDIPDLGDKGQGTSNSLLFIKGDEVVGVQVLASSIEAKLIPLGQAIADAI